MLEFNEKNNIDILGYLTYYLYIEFSDETATICSASMDFTKPITQDAFNCIANAMCNYYKERLNKEVVSSKFVSKEIYDAYIEKFGDNGENIIFNENNYEITINGNGLR